ncbi:hypothetical protein BpHYR1_018963 [Brachionus plicatilis]|uniref:Uncharacterized protein n=1 Tax=Brachionus plicatilis TaxID=10195 RepID=A0A3M7QN50_BRAPC|nr:hypothetical protein BpHYR1_018963 [Brachionus plicatilis]
MTTITNEKQTRSSSVTSLIFTAVETFSLLYKCEQECEYSKEETSGTLSTVDYKLVDMTLFVRKAGESGCLVMGGQLWQAWIDY